MTLSCLDLLVLIALFLIWLLCIVAMLVSIVNGRCIAAVFFLAASVMPLAAGKRLRS